MSRNTDTNFTGSVPHHYDEGLGPHIFVDYAKDLASRAAMLGGADIVEIAAGTGISSRALRDTMPVTSHLTVTDLNAPMLDIARAKFSESEDVRFQVADAMAMPFEESKFDLAVSQCGVMFFPDRVTAYRDIRRVLRPGGHFLFNVWGPMARNPFAETAHGVGVKLFPENPPGFYKAPFGYHDRAQIAKDLADAGFDSVTIEDVPLDKTVTDWALFARGLVLGNPIAEEVFARGVDPADVIVKVEAALSTRFGAAPSRMPLLATVIHARAPA